MLSNEEIVDVYLKSGLIKKCVDMQFLKLKDMYKTQFRDDMFQDLLIILLTYDNGKMNNAHENNHMNALITRMLLNNLWSNTSQFYKRYIKCYPGTAMVNLDEIQEQEDGEDEE